MQLTINLILQDSLCQKIQGGLVKAELNIGTVTFVAKKLATLRQLVAQTPEQKVADMSPELRRHFRILVCGVTKATTENRYSLADVGTNSDELENFSKLLN